MASATLTASAPVPAHTLAIDPVDSFVANLNKSSDKSIDTSEDKSEDKSAEKPAEYQIATDAAADQVHDTTPSKSTTETTPTRTEVPLVSSRLTSLDVPIYARIFPVAQPGLHPGHPEDTEPPHAREANPDSTVSPEEIERRQAEIADFDAKNKSTVALDADAPANADYAHKWALPWHDQRFKSVWFKQPHLLPHLHRDPALRALSHSDPEAFLQRSDVTVEHLSPRFGSIVRGIQLEKLSTDELDQLALFVTQRGVVAFEAQQQFIHSTPEVIQRFAEHFSSVLHEHPVAAEVKGYPKLLPIYRSDTLPINKAFKETLGLTGSCTPTPSFCSVLIGI